MKHLSDYIPGNLICFSDSGEGKQFNEGEVNASLYPVIQQTKANGGILVLFNDREYAGFVSLLMPKTLPHFKSEFQQFADFIKDSEDVPFGVISVELLGIIPGNSENGIVKDPERDLKPIDVTLFEDKEGKLFVPLGDGLRIEPSSEDEERIRRNLLEGDDEGTNHESSAPPLPPLHE